LPLLLLLLLPLQAYNSMLTSVEDELMSVPLPDGSHPIGDFPSCVAELALPAGELLPWGELNTFTWQQARALLQQYTHTAAGNKPHQKQQARRDGKQKSAAAGVASDGCGEKDAANKGSSGLSAGGGGGSMPGVCMGEGGENSEPAMEARVQLAAQLGVTLGQLNCAHCYSLL
jgi:hypothetical protein